MYFSYSGIPLCKYRQLFGEELHLLILMCLFDFVASTLLVVVVQKVAVHLPIRGGRDSFMNGNVYEQEWDSFMYRKPGYCSDLSQNNRLIICSVIDNK